MLKDKTVITNHPDIFGSNFQRAIYIRVPKTVFSDSLFPFPISEKKFREDVTIEIKNGTLVVKPLISGK